MVFNHLTTFKANSRALPEKILMYRVRSGRCRSDFAKGRTESAKGNTLSVSSACWATHLDGNKVARLMISYELPRIKAACRRFDDKYRPRITFVICAKRVSSKSLDRRF